MNHDIISSNLTTFRNTCFRIPWNLMLCEQTGLTSISGAIGLIQLLALFDLKLIQIFEV